MFVVVGLALADHGGQRQGRRGRNNRNHRNQGQRQRGGRTVIRAKPRAPQAQRFNNFPAQKAAPAVPDFSKLGKPPQPAGFNPPQGIPVRGGRAHAQPAAPRRKPVAAAPAPRDERSSAAHFPSWRQQSFVGLSVL